MSRFAEFTVRAVIGALLGALVVFLFWIDPSWRAYTIGAILGAIVACGGEIFLVVGVSDG